MAASPPPAPGGFFPPSGLLSPTPSQASSSAYLHGRLSSSSSSSSSAAYRLPLPRRTPLRPGSAKEDLVRNYMDERILRIRRRFVKKYVLDDPAEPRTAPVDDDIVGYRSMGELCADVDVLVNHLWRSASPRLQVPYFLQLAGDLVTWMDGFAPSPRATLALLRKLDYCFATLLATSTNAMTRTDMVRCRSIAEQSRVAVVDVFRRGPPDPLDEPEEAQEEDEDDGKIKKEEDDADVPMANASTTSNQQQDDPDFDPGIGDGDDDDEDDGLEMGVAKVYERTLVQLGEVLGDGYARIGDFPTPTRPAPVVDEIDDENDNDYDDY